MLNILLKIYLKNFKYNSCTIAPRIYSMTNYFSIKTLENTNKFNSINTIDVMILNDGCQSQWYQLVLLPAESFFFISITQCLHLGYEMSLRSTYIVWHRSKFKEFSFLALFRMTILHYIFQTPILITSVAY